MATILLCTLLAAGSGALCSMQRVLHPRMAPAAVVPAQMPQDRTIFPDGNAPSIALPGNPPRRIRSLLRTPDRMTYGNYLWRDMPRMGGSVWVLIDLKRQMLSVFRNGDEIGSTVILYGMKDKPTPPGAFSILEKDAHHSSSLYDAEMPYMLRLTNDGVAIHASDVQPASATHGCIGVPGDFARLLFARMRVGDRVYVVREMQLVGNDGPSSNSFAMTMASKPLVPRQRQAGSTTFSL